MNQATPERIAKLPVWAREHINDLERARRAAIDALAKFQNENNSGPFLFSDFVCCNTEGGPSQFEHRVNAYKLEVFHADVHMAVTLSDEDAIKIRWAGGAKSHSMGDVCMIPESYQQVRLVHPHHAVIR